MGIVGVLALALGGLLWRNRNTAAPTPSSTTTLLAIVTTSTSTSTTPTTVPAPTTTTEEQRIAEVEAILTDLWFGWFDAIYREDANALWAVVATNPQYESGLTAMTELQFVEAPSTEAITVTNAEILLDRPDCLVAFYIVDFAVVSEQASPLVSVMWPDERYGMRFATHWLYANDLWLADCDEVVRQETP